MNRSLRVACWSLLVGNAAIGCGVFAPAGTMADLARDLHVAVPVAGQLVTLGAVAMGVGAPAMAMLLGGMDRRRLLSWTLLWYAAGHALSALAPSYAALLPVRVLSVLGAAVFTPQAAAAIGALCEARGAAELRGRAIAFIFVGWAVASVLGMPLHALVADSFGWRWAFAGVAALSALCAAGVWLTLPDGLRPGAMNLADWGRTLSDARLMGLVAVTALSAAGQFTLLTYLAPYVVDVLHGDGARLSAVFFCFGLCGLIGNVLLTRWIDRLGAAPCATFALMGMTATMALWPLAGSVPAAMLAVVPWGLGCFAANSAQQARLAAEAPQRATALMAMNTSALYIGQGLGAAGGGLMVARAGLTALWPVALVWLGLAVMLSARLGRKELHA